MEITYYSILFIIIILILIYLSGWFSSTETALTNLSLIDIISLDKKDKKTKYVKKLRKNLDLSIISILILNNIVNVLLSVLPVIILGFYFNEFQIGILISLITIIIILFGDIIPKSRAITNKKKIILRNGKIMYYLFLITKPLVFLLIHISKFFNKNKVAPVLINDNIIREITNLSYKRRLIKEIELNMISNILLFGDLKIKDIMLKKNKVFIMNKDHSIEKAREIVSKKPYTRIPYIVDEKVLGIVYAKDLIKNNKKYISEIVRNPIFIKEDLDISYVLKNMKKKRIHLAIVIDKNKKFKGIVTFEDIIETIVGDVKDEYSKEKN